MFNQRRYRPLGLADVFDEAFDLYKSNFMLFLAVAACAYVPLMAFMVAMVTQGTAYLYPLGYESLIADFGKTAGQLIVEVLFWVVASTIASCPLVYAVSQRYLDRPVTLAQSYGQALRRILPVIACIILTLLLTVIGYLLCIVPGVYLASRFICITQVVMIEPKQSPFAAIRRSYRLTAPFYWRIIGSLMLLSLIEFALVMAIRGPLDFLIGVVPFGSLPGLGVLAANQDLTDQIAMGFATLLVFPYTYTLLTVLYYDMRIREEGYDMAIVADHLGLASADQAGTLPQAKPPTPGTPPRKPPFWQRPGNRRPGAAAS